MKLRFLSIGVVLGVVHVAHSLNCFYYGGRTYLVDDMAQNINNFSTNLYKAVLNEPSVDGNFISSPLSVAMVLLMTGFGARGSTAAELDEFLYSESLTECTVRTLTAELNSYKNVELSLANNIFADMNLNINPEFQASVKFASIYGIERANFAQSNVAVRKINNWCEQKTHSRIQDLLTPDDVSGDTKLVLVNAIYFKGKWAQPFDKQFTKSGRFIHTDGSVTNVPMMFAMNEYSYGSIPNLPAKFIELPYESKNPDDGVSMFIILPDEHNGLGKVENGIRNVSLVTLRSEEKEITRLIMPSFKIESKIELTDILQTMGMKEIFSNRADFSGISEDSKLKVSKIVQKAFIEVNEEGSEAAAATGGLMVDRMGVNTFNVNHPFLVLIATEDVILFSGRVTDPHQ